ncbi:nucleoside hydrolase [Hyalangium versicolor]|uniref:nucleoside hydrolase n=1 Tax=Hyalangium versicolor TaxID=2861190 RepID=UPI001CC97C2F|nr:nucleoside hydrolase [Hyalangium versicolor]
MSTSNLSTPVVLLHDAAIDEYMATILLTTMSGIDLRAIVVVNGDCITTPAMNAAWRIQQFIGRTNIPLGLSAARGYNPFPWEYRGDCIKQDSLAMLQALQPLATPYRDGDALLREVLQSATEPVTVLCTGPFTPLAMLLDRADGAALIAKIGRVVWMGGAINVGGNLDPQTLPPGVANPYAEWNVFWDPFAADRVFRNTTFPITLFPLDITNSAAITASFMSRLLENAKRYPTSNLAYQSYEFVAAESFYDMWDVTAAVWLARPDLYAAPQTLQLAVVTEDTGMLGALVPSESGRAIDVVGSFTNISGFYDYVLQQLAR